MLASHYLLSQDVYVHVRYELPHGLNYFVRDVHRNMSVTQLMIAMTIHTHIRTVFGEKIEYRIAHMIDTTKVRTIKTFLEMNSKKLISLM